MKNLCLLLPLLTLSCNAISEVDRTIDKEESFKEQYFFNFNKVDYYSIGSERDLGEVLVKDTLDKMDRFYLSVVNDNNHSEKGFVDSLEMIGFEKLSVEQSTVGEFYELFKSHKMKELEMTACEPIYRDILVFMDGSNIVGVAKICFSCQDHFILGSSVSTESFGQFGEYQKLLELLDKS